MRRELSAPAERLGDRLAFGDVLAGVGDRVGDRNVVDQISRDGHAGQDGHAASEKRGHRAGEASNGDHPDQRAEDRELELECVPFRPALSAS